MSDHSNRDATIDIGRQHIASVYARALLGVTQGQGQTVAALAELDSLVDDVFDKLPSFESALASPRVGVDEKLAMLQNAFGTRMLPTLLTFLKVVAQHGRLDCVRQIRRATHHVYHELSGQVEVEVQTASPVDEAVLTRIVERLTAVLQRKVVLHSQVNPAVLGGIVVRVGDTVFDGSVNNQLEKMRADALTRAAREVRDALDRFVAADS